MSKMDSLTAEKALEQAADTIADQLYERDLDGARATMNAAVQGQEAGPLVRQLADTVTMPAGMVVWGFALDIWANPYRDPGEYAWRCGGCRWTASHYNSEQACVASAEKHATEEHSGTLAVVSYLDEKYWDACQK